jgi:spore germination protein YaaH
MTIDTRLIDGRGTGQGARITAQGQLVVAPADFSESATQTMGTNDTPVNFWGPIQKKNFIITDILLYANKNVGAADATVTLYESTDGPATATQSKVILQTEMLKQTSRDLIGLNIRVTEGSWVNGVTDDDDIFATVAGYYITTGG